MSFNRHEWDAPELVEWEDSTNKRIVCSPYACYPATPCYPTPCYPRPCYPNCQPGMCFPRRR